MPGKTLFVQFGGTGDLARKKLYPAYSELASKGFDFQVIALGRRYKDTSDFFMGIGIGSSLKDKVHYLRFDLDSPETKELKALVGKLADTDTTVILYLAVLPEYYSKVVPIMAELGDSLPSGSTIRVVLEKPFGYDSATAGSYDELVKSRFSEDDIFRVDHYLGKEFIQNILVMRFTNEVINGIWNKDYIDHIQMILDEEHGIEQRMDYYNKVGVVRDMLQNHILQLVTHVLMEEPESFIREDISTKKLKVLKSIGSIDDHVIARYKTCPSSSRGCAPTYVALKLHASEGKLADVPIYIRTGKRQSHTRSQIYIQFKNFMTKTEQREDIPPNSMTIDIQPEMKIDLRLNVKRPNESWSVHPVRFNFNHMDTFKINTPEAYEQILEKIILGDKTLFPSSEEIMESWRIVEPLISLDDDKIGSYEDGSMPDQAKSLIEKDGRRWNI